MSLPSLTSLLDQHYNEEELRSLCFHLGIDYDNLGGRGKAANARELLALLQRQQRLPDLLHRVRQERPTVVWPAAPPPRSAALDALQEEAQQLFAVAEQLLFPHVWSRDEREALLSEAFYPAHLWLLKQIDVDGAADTFLPTCWRVLRQGAADGSLTIRLLRTLRLRYGADGQVEIDNLMTAWQRLCASQMVVQATAVDTSTAAPARQPVSGGADQATLFLSYADRDAALAERLAAALATHGYPCQVARAPKTDNSAWLAATAAALGNAYAVVWLIGEQSAADRWQRLEYLAAADRQKPIIPVQLRPTVPLPAYVEQAVLPLAAEDLTALLQRLPTPTPPGDGRRKWR